MTTGKQDSNGFPASLGTKASPVATDHIEISDSADGDKPKLSPVSGLPFVPTASLPLSMANGGTNKALTAANGGIVYSDADSMEILAPTVTARQMLQSGASTAPAWSTATYPATTTINGILYSSAANVVGQIAAANNGVMVSSNTGVPSMLAGSGVANNILMSQTAAAPIWSTATYPATTTINRLMYSSAANTISELATANSATLVTSSTGVPVWTSSMTDGQILIGVTGGTPVRASITAGSGVTITPGAGTITIAATGSGGTVTSVSGTTNRITSTGGATPVIDISASYVGQASITTLGTITTGVWNGTGVTVPYGGTGVTTFTTAYGTVCAGTTATGALQTVSPGTSGQALISAGNAALPAYGTLSVSGGGTGLTTSTTAYGVVCAGTTATGAYQVLNALGASGTVLTSNGAGALPSFQAAAAGSGTWTKISTVTASASATVDFSNLLNSTYKYYMILAYNVLIATDATNFEARFGTGAGPTWKSGATDYTWGCQGGVGQASGHNEAGTVGAAFMQLNGGITLSNTSSWPTEITLYIPDPSNASYFGRMFGTIAGLSTLSSETSMYIFNGAYKTTGAVTSFRFLMSSGNITSGTFELWGFVGA